MRDALRALLLEERVGSLAAWFSLRPFPRLGASRSRGGLRPRGASALRAWLRDRRAKGPLRIIREPFAKPPAPANPLNGRCPRTADGRISCGRRPAEGFFPAGLYCVIRWVPIRLGRFDQCLSCIQRHQGLLSRSSFGAAAQCAAWCAGGGSLCELFSSSGLACLSTFALYGLARVWLQVYVIVNKRDG